MVAIDRIRVGWSGFAGSPGISTFYANTGPTLVPLLRTFFEAFPTDFPNTVRISVPTSGDTLESTTGALLGVWSGGTGGVTAGQSTANYSAVTGALLQWGTATILSGRRLKGHTFLVPFRGDAYDTSGRVADNIKANIDTNAAALVASAAGNMLVWQRPRVARPSFVDRKGVTHPAITARGGGYAPVTTGVLRSIVTELRSRRD